MFNLAFICTFILLPIWGGYEGDNMLLWTAGAVLLFIPGLICLHRELHKGGR